MGRIKDFIAKWQDIDRPEWEKEVVESKKNIKYTTGINKDQKKIIEQEHNIKSDQVGEELTIHYSENGEFVVYIHFSDTEDETQIFADKFESRKKAKDDVEYLMDKYTELLGK